MLRLTDGIHQVFFWFSTDLKSMTVSTTSADRNRNDDHYQLHHPVAIIRVNSSVEKSKERYTR